MKKIILKTLSVFISVFMILSLLPVVSFAEDTVTPYTDFTLDIDSINSSAKTITLGTYNGTSTTVVVPGSYVIDGVTYTTVIDSSNTFKGNTSIKSVTLKSGVKFKKDRMNHLFYGCEALTTVNLSERITAGITNMTATFGYCSSLTSLDVSNFDTSKVTTLHGMFYKATNLVVTGYENWDTSNVTNITYLFDEAMKMTTIDLSKWNLSKVTTTMEGLGNNTATDIILPDSLPIISSCTFNHATGYNKSSFTLPAGVKTIGYAHTFYDFGTSAFNEFKVAEGNTNFKAVDGVLYSMDGTTFIAMPRGKTHTNNIYEVLEGVTFIPELSFSKTQKISTLVIPNSYVIRQRVLDYDPEYIHASDSSDLGNLNSGNSLSIAVYRDTSIANYEVKDSNPRYKSDRGIIYSKDMSKIIAIPLKYNKDIIIPEGVKTWEDDAIYYDGRAKATSNHTVKIPASMTYIGANQLATLVHLKKDKNWTMEVDENNPVYKVDENGYIVQYGISDGLVSLSATSYAHDGTAKTPAVTVKLATGTVPDDPTEDDTTPLTEGTDYSVEYINNKNAGTAQVKITGKGSYSGEIYKEFYIESATPYTDFQGEGYIKDDTAKTITLGKYNGTATTVVVPGTYTVNGTLYTTVIDANTTFRNNTSIKSVTLSSGVKFKDNSMKYLFRGCTALEELNLSKLSTSNVTNMYAAFNGCTSLKNIDLSNFDTSKVTDFYSIFSNSTNLNVKGIEKWDTRAATNMAYMFYNVKGTQEIDLSAWNFRKVSDVSNMFSSCEASNVILPNSRTLLPVENQPSSVSSYEVNAENIYYSSDNGIIYSDDMSKVIAVPYKYNKDIVIPEGVKRWEADAFNVAKQANATDSHKIIIPASMTYIENNQLALINYLKDTKSWTIEVDKDNPVYKVDASEYIVQYGISDALVSLSATSYTYDETTKTPTVTVKAATDTTTVSTTTLTPEEDYTIEYIDNIKAGIAKVKITGKGSYSGIVYKPFNIGSATSTALKCTKFDNDIAVEFHPETVDDIESIEKLQLIVAYYDMETDAFLRMEKKVVRDFSNYLAESFKPATDGEYARVFIWRGDFSDITPAHSHMTVEL